MSENAWCGDKCDKEEDVQRVIEKIRNLTRVPTTNSEYLQILKYEVDESYKTYHDFIEHDIE